MRLKSRTCEGFFYLGLAVALGAFVRYFILWPDPDKFFFYPAVGLLISGAAAIIDYIKDMNRKYIKLGEEVHKMGSEVNQQFGDIRDIKSFVGMPDPYE